MDQPLTEKVVESRDCPRFIAYAAEDSYVDADDDLNELIANILLSDETREDVVIWEDGDRIVAVITRRPVRTVRRTRL